MTLVFKRSVTVVLALFVSIAAGADKEHARLEVGPASSYPYKQTSEGLVMAADVFETGEKVKDAFGKHNPYDYGVLPILVVIENTANKAIDLSHMRVQYVMQGHGKVDATPPGDLAYIHGARRPGITPAPLPIPGLPQTTGLRPVTLLMASSPNSYCRRKTSHGCRAVLIHRLPIYINCHPNRQFFRKNKKPRLHFCKQGWRKSVSTLYLLTPSLSELPSVF